MVWLLLGCADPADPCTATCDAAASLYGGCLADWGAGWEAAGYADEADFVDACATWAWELRQLEADAGRTGEVDAECEARTEALAAEDATCDTYTSMDWNTPPWEG